MLWLNGEAVTDATAAFDLTDRGLLLGDGVFDTALVVHGAVVWRDAHLSRLLEACAAIGLAPDVLWRGQRLDERLAAAMALASRDMALGSIRVTVTRGAGPRGVVAPAQPVPTVMASRAPMPEPVAFQPLSLWLSAVRRNETSVTSRVKSLGYLDAILETGKARAAGCDETLLLNTRGAVACAGVGNIFVLQGDRLLTPPLADGVLAGVTRAAIVNYASDAGLTASEQSLTPAELTHADAIYVSNSLRLLAPVTRIGDVALRQNADAFARLRAALVAHMGLAGRLF